MTTTSQSARRAAVALRRFTDGPYADELSADERDWAHILQERLFEIHNRHVDGVIVLPANARLVDMEPT